MIKSPPSLSSFFFTDKKRKLPLNTGRNPAKENYIKRKTSLHSDKTLRENVKRKTPVYTDKTLGQENKEEEEGEGGDEEIERENMYSELELMNELGLSLSNCNFLVG